MNALELMEIIVGMLVWILFVSGSVLCITAGISSIRNMNIPDFFIGTSLIVFGLLLFLFPIYSILKENIEP